MFSQQSLSSLSAVSQQSLSGLLVVSQPNSTINKLNSINLIFMIIFGLLLMVAAVPKEFFNANDCYDEILVIVTECTQQKGLD